MSILRLWRQRHGRQAAAAVAVSCVMASATTVLASSGTPPNNNNNHSHSYDDQVKDKDKRQRQRQHQPMSNLRRTRSQANGSTKNEDEEEEEEDGSNKESEKQETSETSMFAFRRRRLSSLLRSSNSSSSLPEEEDADSANKDENENENENENESHAAAAVPEEEEQVERLSHVKRRQSTRVRGGDDALHARTTTTKLNNIQTRKTAAAAAAVAVDQHNLNSQSPPVRDTFLYAKEIESLNQEHPLQTVHDNHDDSNKNVLSRTLSSIKKMPFPPHVVGTFSCHGIEPLPIQRLLSPLELQFFLLTNHNNNNNNNNTPSLSSSSSSLSLVHAKINQDRGVVAHPYGNDPNMALFGVFDGHGLHGDDVAHYAMKETLHRLKHNPRFPTKTVTSTSNTNDGQPHASTNQATRIKGINNNINGNADNESEYSNIAQAFCEIFHQMDQDLHLQQRKQKQRNNTNDDNDSSSDSVSESNSNYIDHVFSGTTACVVLVENATRTLYMANIGDSRAVLAVPTKHKHHHHHGGGVHPQSSASTQHTHTHTHTRTHRAIELTQDQYPMLAGERERLEALGGYITQTDGTTGRVWNRAPHQHKQTVRSRSTNGSNCNKEHMDPMYGLAMSRSIGDHFLEPVGVIATPVITAHELPSSSSASDDNGNGGLVNDVFLILASDGVWSVMDSDEAVRVVADALNDPHHGHDASVACEILIETAMEQWRAVEGEYRDDITAVVVRLDHLFD
jgi:serine/threonine protein phosphatase PrpC